MKAERLFFMYAFPALETCSSVPREKIKELEKILLFGHSSPNWNELEELVPRAIQRLDRMAEREGLEPRSYEAAKKYWWEEHNRIIDAREDGYDDAPSHACEACKVSFVEVSGVDSDEIHYYNVGGENRIARTYFSDLEVGDFVTVHLGRVVEKISMGDYKQYRE